MNTITEFLGVDDSEDSFQVAPVIGANAENPPLPGANPEQQALVANNNNNNNEDEQEVPQIEG